ncbi:MAG TPA: DUF1080 domain-containing protein [Candidatus Brocadiia bacterium]|nr:DUF1080 domain-containing protein [Candidatus Brocadiia bacterium]
MLRKILLTIPALVVMFSTVAWGEPIAPAERIQLFNGKDTSGWDRFVGEGDPAPVWTVKDGILRCAGAPHGYIKTQAEYKDYILHLEWRWDGEPGNSGVLLHMSGQDAIWPKSIECQLFNGHAGDMIVMQGTEFNEHKGKQGICVPQRNPSSENKPGEWNRYDIVCSGDSITAFVNGVLQNEATGASERSGKICFQSEGGVIEFRNIYVEPVAAVARLWNGKDFAGWTRFLGEPNADPDKTWKVANGVLRCYGKPAGYIRTDAEYENYVLHVEWRWAGGMWGGNSGVLIHMSQPDMVWPKSIECQLAAGNAGDFWVIEGTEFDEHKRNDGGRADGRRMMKLGKSSEKPRGQWNAYDITCKGNTIEVMVNGVRQNAATNTSVSKGKICLQSEGERIEFRNIYLRPIK